MKVDVWPKTLEAISKTLNWFFFLAVIDRQQKIKPTIIFHSAFITFGLLCWSLGEHKRKYSNMFIKSLVTGGGIWLFTDKNVSVVRKLLMSISLFYGGFLNERKKNYKLILRYKNNFP